ncbi:hypothetical protein Pan216_04720 [Planctomycetes bacterium Pan216]|uniref:Uncharacterized protein n=1 Tax=Kolteria novifilia TaxID=2527975 RepID=A0A518AY45_9BACT|nr:hypothetical protein Pan216_04720 [Planctomycetes bacterium Pan216]
MDKIIGQMPRLQKMLEEFYSQVEDAKDQIESPEMISEIDRIVGMTKEYHGKTVDGLLKANDEVKKARAEADDAVAAAKKKVEESKKKLAEKQEARKLGRQKPKYEKDEKMAGELRKNLLERIRGLKPESLRSRRDDDVEFVDWAHATFDGGTIHGDVGFGTIAGRHPVHADPTSEEPSPEVPPTESEPTREDKKKPPRDFESWQSWLDTQR